MKSLRSEMSKLLFLVIAIVLIIFLIHNFWSSLKEVINYIMSFFIRMKKNKQVDSYCETNDQFVIIFDEKIVNHHIIYIILKLFQENSKHSVENIDQDCMKDSTKLITAGSKKIYLLPESCESFVKKNVNVIKKTDKYKKEN